MKRGGFKNPGKPMARKLRCGCGHKFDAALGAYGCTNCKGEQGPAHGRFIQSAMKPKQGSQLARQASNKAPPKKRSRGMKGRAPTAEERRFMDAAGALPCIACQKDGRHEPVISLHHVDGRTKPGAHFLVLPLCASHHQQDDSDPLQRQSVHGRKATFTARYGTELELLAEVRALLSAGQEPPPSSESVAD